jgi:hypothetical protein
MIIAISCVSSGDDQLSYLAVPLKTIYLMSSPFEQQVKGPCLKASPSVLGLGAERHICVKGSQFSEG